MKRIIFDIMKFPRFYIETEFPNVSIIQEMRSQGFTSVQHVSGHLMKYSMVEEEYTWFVLRWS